MRTKPSRLAQLEKLYYTDIPNAKLGECQEYVEMLEELERKVYQELRKELAARVR